MTLQESYDRVMGLVPAPPPEIVVPLRERMLTVKQLHELPPPTWLVGGYLELDSLALIFGRRGAMKSFVALDLLASVASGARWHQHAVSYGPCIYVAAESPGGLQYRFDSWQALHTHETIGDRLLTLPEPINLMSPYAVGEFAEVAVEFGAKLIVFDTLARCMIGGDENSTKDAGFVVDQLDSIRRKTGACVSAVHHAGKMTGLGARGSSAFEAAADTVIEVSAADGVVSLKQTKQKNHVELPLLSLSPVTFGRSIALDQWRPPDDLVPAGALEILTTLREIALPAGVSTATLRVAVALPERSFYRHLKALLEAGLVSNIGSIKMPRYLPEPYSAATTANPLPPLP